MQDKTVTIVTGAVGSMGAACARLFAGNDTDLILCDLDAARLEAFAAELQASGRVDVVACDLASDAFIESLLAAIGDRRVTAVVHTAGLSPTMADAARIIEVNFTATHRIVDALRDRMAQGGAMLLISSIAAYMFDAAAYRETIAQAVAERSAAGLLDRADSPEMAYPLSKRAVMELVAREALDFGRRGARLLSLAPGMIDTPMSRSEMEKTPAMHDMLAATPAGRLGKPEEIASTAHFLCSPGAAYISGSDIRVDGGTIAGLGL